MDPKRSTNRRQLLKSLGASVSVPLLAQPVSAARTKQDLFAKARKALRQRKNETAKTLFEKAGVNYSIESMYIPNNSEEVSTRDFFEEEKSWVSLGAASDINNSNQVVLTFTWDMKNHYDDLDTAGPDDVVAVVWEGSEYGYVSGSASYDATSHYTENDKQDIPVTMDAPPLLGDGSQNAAAFTVDDGKQYQSMSVKHLTGYVDLNIRDQSSSRGQVAAEYLHNWTYLGISDINILERLSITYANLGVSVDLPSGADSDPYRMEKDLPF